MRGQIDPDGSGVVIRGVALARGGPGRQVAWRHGHARAPATRLADWRQEDDGGVGLVDWADRLGRQVGCTGKCSLSFSK